MSKSAKTMKFLLRFLSMNSLLVYYYIYISINGHNEKKKYPFRSKEIPHTKIQQNLFYEIDDDKANFSCVAYND